jgi:hypothetical protein
VSEKQLMQTLKKIVPWIVSAALCVLAAEIFGAAVFLVKNGALVYQNTQKVPDPVVAAATYRQRLHPYFGYTGPYSLASKTMVTNNLGFGQLQKRLVPFKPETNDFVVFVFGASIAGNVVAPPQGGAPLQGILQKIPQLKDKNVVVYNMAQGPQKQLAFLFALGQHIDLVLNVDGSVEFTSGLSNFESGIDPIFPPAATLGAIGRELEPVDSSSANYYELAFHLSRDRAAIKLYSKLVAESTSGLGFLRNRFILGYYSRSLANDLANYEGTITRKGDWGDTQKLLSLDMAVSVTNDNVMDAIFQTWLRCSDMMKLMANSNGAAFLEIVHPNPYHSKKKLTQSEEAAVAIPQTNYLRRASFEGYNLIEQRADMLKSRNIISALALFDDNPETIYIDSTGHFSRIGESLFGQFIADQVAAKLGSTRVNSGSSK